MDQLVIVFTCATIQVVLGSIADSELVMQLDAKRSWCLAELFHGPTHTSW